MAKTFIKNKMMQFSLSNSLEILKSTPSVLYAMLGNLSEDWINANEGENTWTPKEIVAHLILNEKTNWVTRARIILSDSAGKTFTRIDMVGHFDLSRNYSLPDLLKQFTQHRENSIRELELLHLTEDSFRKTAIHPTMGTVTLEQLIATEKEEFTVFCIAEIQNNTLVLREIDERNCRLVGLQILR